MGQRLDARLPPLLRYRHLLPLDKGGPVVTLGEGNTPLVHSAGIGPALGLHRLYFKLESANPTGSYKDRFAALCVSRALQRGAPGLVGTSSGNAGSANAAYAARAGLPYVLFVPEGAPAAKLAQARAYGAHLIAVRRFALDPVVTTHVFEYVRALSEEQGWDVTITAYRYNAPAMEGVKTLSWELLDDLGAAPEWVFVPVGGGGAYHAVWRGFAEALPGGRRPRCVAVHPEGVPFISEALAAGTADIEAKPCTSEISGLQVPRPPDAALVLASIAESGGTAVPVSDALVLRTQAELAQKEGILCEPAGAAALAGLIALLQQQRIDPDATVVCCVTGHGLKDLARLEQMAEAAAPVPAVDPRHLEAAVRQILEGTP